MICFYYPHVPYGGTDIIDYSAMLTAGACESQTDEAFRCHFIDLRPIFEGHPDYIGIDGIHPTLAGATAIATEIYRIMEANCVGQPEASACCDG